MEPWREIYPSRERDEPLTHVGRIASKMVVDSPTEQRVILGRVMRG